MDRDRPFFIVRTDVGISYQNSPYFHTARGHIVDQLLKPPYDRWLFENQGCGLCTGKVPALSPRLIVAKIDNAGVRHFFNEDKSEIMRELLSTMTAVIGYYKPRRIGGTTMRMVCSRAYSNYDDASRYYIDGLVSAVPRFASGLGRPTDYGVMLYFQLDDDSAVKLWTGPMKRIEYAENILEGAEALDHFGSRIPEFSQNFEITITRLATDYGNNHHKWVRKVEIWTAKAWDIALNAAKAHFAQVEEFDGKSDPN